MGEVYRARDHSLAREVAVKVLPEGLAADPIKQRRFEQEARAAAALNHPNILTVFRFGTTATHVPYLITELLQGQTLRERLDQGRIPVRKSVEYALQIARGLTAAHERGIVHRDLKPENLFITRDGLVKILDFGLAKLITPDVSETQTTVAMSLTEPGLVLGTVGYMSPEQVRGQPVDHRSDIFSLGSILYETLCGQRAFQGPTSADTMGAILKEEPVELSTRVGDLPPGLGRVVHRCLEKDPGERFQSARDLSFNLELLTRDESRSVAGLTVPVKKRSHWRVALVSLLALLAAAGLGFMAARRTVSPARNSAPVVLKRLTDFVGMEEFPALSPDEKSVAFTAAVGGRRQIWVRLLAGGAPLQITHDDADHLYPRWSSDSDSLVYFSPAPEPDGQGKIWEVPALGGNARPLVTSIGGGDLSHDGKHLAYFRSGKGQFELTVADADGSNPRVLAGLSTNFAYSDLAWSPDDRMIGFQQGRVFSYDIYYVSATGGQPTKITQEGNLLAGFAWLPDSSGVVYATSRGDTVLYLPTMNLWSVRMGGKDLRQLTFGETSYASPDVDRSGNLVASRSRVQFDVWKYPVGDNPQANVAHGIQITHQTGAVQTPSVGPDDQEVAYLSDSGGHGNIWILNLETDRSRQITFERDARIALGVPVWSPDGAHIAYVTRSRTGWNVDQWIVNRDGTNAQKVSVGGGWATWSPDSRWLYFAEPDAQGKFNIAKVSPDGSTRLAVRGDGQRPAISADGALYYASELPSVNGPSDLEIRVARPETGQSSPLARIPGSRLPPWMMVQPVLSPDGKWLAITLANASVTDIWAQPTSGGEMRRITDFRTQATFITRRVSWSSDGRSIYAAVGKGEADIVLLSNLVH